MITGITDKEEFIKVSTESVELASSPLKGGVKWRFWRD